MSAANAPIALIDSDYSGLNTLRILHRHFPHENYHYHLDLRVGPYADRSKDLVMQSTLAALQRVSGAKAIILNDMCAASLIFEESVSGIPLINLFNLSLTQAIKHSHRRSVGFIGDRFLHEHDQFGHFFATSGLSVEDLAYQSTPLLKPLLDEHLIEDPLTNLLLFRYLNPMVEKGIDQLIPGQVAYLRLEKSFLKVLGEDVTVIDPIDLVAQKLARDFNSGEIAKNQNKGSGQVEISATDELREGRIKQWLRPVPYHQLTSVNT